ncbi:MAG: hypothetical protein ABJI60_03260 [Kangiellaceae bacterium]
MKNLILLLAILLIYAKNLSAEEFSIGSLHHLLAKCAKIESNKLRLKCFDNIKLKNYKSNTVRAENITNTQTQTKTSEKAVENVPSETVPSPNQTSNSAVNNFGKKLESNSSITSYLKGDFKKWVKGQKLHLENGQIWEVRRAQSGYKHLKNPKITITVGYLGSFTAKIDGLNATAKVRRIK